MRCRSACPPPNILRMACAVCVAPTSSSSRIAQCSVSCRRRSRAITVPGQAARGPLGVRIWGFAGFLKPVPCPRLSYTHRKANEPAYEGAMLFSGQPRSVNEPVNFSPTLRLGLGQEIQAYHTSLFGGIGDVAPQFFHYVQNVQELSRRHLCLLCELDYVIKIQPALARHHDYGTERVGLLAKIIAGGRLFSRCSKVPHFQAEQDIHHRV